MFRDDEWVKPSNRSILFTFAIAVVSFLGNYLSPVIGYFLSLLTLGVFVFVYGFYSGSVWPTKRQRENAMVFSVHWGLVLGLIIPLLISMIIEGGIGSILELIMSK